MRASSADRTDLFLALAGRLDHLSKCVRRTVAGSKLKLAADVADLGLKEWTVPVCGSRNITMAAAMAECAEFAHVA